MEMSDQIVSTARLLTQAGNVVLSEFGITMGTYEVILLISKGNDTTTKLGNATKSTLANITHKTKALEKEGFIERSIGDRDKRVWTFALTTKGKKFLGSVQRYYGEALDRLFSQFSEDQTATALDVIATTRQHLEALIQDEGVLAAYAKDLAQKGKGKS
jgi:DNA-binding MarR family transcriptional regulator